LITLGADDLAEVDRESTFALDSASVNLLSSSEPRTTSVTLRGINLLM
jgi:hypothetical protein